MGLVAQMTETVSGKRFDIASRDLVFAPLGLSCGFNWAGVPDAEARAGATLYRRDAAAGGPWEVQTDGDPGGQVRPSVFAMDGLGLADYRVGSNGLVFGPQGGLRASVMDLAAIGIAMTGARPLLAAETRAMIAAPVWRANADRSNGDTSDGAFMAFGTGVHIIPAGPGGPVPGLSRPLIGHYGDAYGLLAGLWVDQASGKGFAWFVNGSPNELAKGRSGIFAIEEEMMQAAAADLGLA
jgi:hypothetical protein